MNFCLHDGDDIPDIDDWCPDPDCDGYADHDGPHFQWVPE